MRTTKINCDLCGCEIDGSPTLIKMGWGNSTPIHEYDICNGCREKIQKELPSYILAPSTEHNVIVGFVRSFFKIG